MQTKTTPRVIYSAETAAAIKAAIKAVEHAFTMSVEDNLGSEIRTELLEARSDLEYSLSLLYDNT